MVQLPLLNKVAILKEGEHTYFVLPLTHEYEEYIKNTLGKQTSYNINGLKFSKENFVKPISGESVANLLYRIIFNNSSTFKTGIVYPVGYNAEKNTCDAPKNPKIPYETTEASEPSVIKEYYFGRLGNPKKVLIVKVKLKNQQK